MIAIENNLHIWHFESKDRMRLLHSIGREHDIKIGRLYDFDDRTSHFYKLSLSNNQYWESIDSDLIRTLYGISSNDSGVK